ncbi:MAG: protein phosphatase 2C domain-containing protein [Methanomicrobiales archaeon]|nr:protein phosphatase 2C domain-containing protein [Methanomicrobiales archaeon]
MNRDDLPPVHGADLGWAFGCSRKGASHFRGGKPCQDAYALWSGASLESSYLIAAVADGHGDRLHDLSQIGASFATRAAVEELLGLCPEAGNGSAYRMEEEFPRTFPSRVTERWRGYVRGDADVRTNGTSGIDPDIMTRRYGTTLLAARISSRHILLGQIGDGDVLLLGSDDRISYPLEIEQELLGLSTYSLASRNAVSLWKTTVIPRGQGGLLLLATDGLSDSFGGSDHAEFQRFVRSLRERIDQYGIGKVAASLPHWLSQFSDRGSGDDITLVIMDILPGAGEEGQAKAAEDADDAADRTED